MEWAAIISALIKIVAGVTDYLSRQQLLEAGQAQAIAKGLQQTLDNLEKAKHVKEELAARPDGDFANRVQHKYERPDER